jgi:hypothetical protein
MYCKTCGKEVKEGDIFCGYCGARVDDQKENNMSNDLNNIVRPINDGSASPRSRLITFLLCFFLGGFGAHEFYVGKTGAGILMLVFCWTGIPSIIAFIQWIMILCGTFKDAEGRPITLW